MTTKLEPPDLARCQAELHQRTPFALGGTHKVIRCKNKPLLIVEESKPGPDGQHGSMSLCMGCLNEFNQVRVAREFIFKELK